MANEIKVVASLQCDNGNFKLPKAGGAQVNITQAAPGGGVPGLVIATNAAQGVAVSVTGVSTEGWVRMENVDDTAIIDWGVDDGGGNLIEVGKMEPGEPALFRMDPTATLRLRSSVASSKVIVTILED